MGDKCAFEGMKRKTVQTEETKGIILNPYLRKNHSQDSEQHSNDKSNNQGTEAESFSRLEIVDRVFHCDSEKAKQHDSKESKLGYSKQEKDQKGSLSESQRAMIEAKRREALERRKQKMNLQ